MEPPKALHSNSNPEKEEQIGGITLPNICLLYTSDAADDC